MAATKGLMFVLLLIAFAMLLMESGQMVILLPFVFSVQFRYFQLFGLTIYTAWSFRLSQLRWITLFLKT